MAVGMEFVAREIHFYTIFETVYLKEQSPAADQLAASLVNTYALLLRHLVSSAKYFDTSLLSRSKSSTACSRFFLPPGHFPPPPCVKFVPF